MKASDKLRILAMEFCFNADIPKKTKIKQLEFIKEADPYVCLGYILDGKFYQLNESGKKEIKERFLKEQGTNLTMRRKSVHSAVGAVGNIVTGGTGYLAYRALKGLFSKCARACGVLGLNTTKRQYCLITCKVKAKQQEISALQKMTSECKGDQKCIQNLQKKIANNKESLQGLLKKQMKMKQFMVSHGKDMSKADNVDPNQMKIV